jgi:hypothetical protein
MDSDDNTPAFGVRTSRTIAAIDEASAEQTADELDPDLEIPVKESEDPRPNTAEEQAADDELHAKCLDTMSKSPAEVRAEREHVRARKP